MQKIMSLMGFDLNLQAALDTPLWQWLGGKKVGIEQGISRDFANALARRGYETYRQ